MLRKPLSDLVISKIASLTSNEILIRSIPRAVIKKDLKTKLAAVLIPLCNRHGIPSIIFTVRTNTVSTHKGQVSFPGGHLEPTEDASAAAVRETKEELGDAIGQISVLGKFEAAPAVTGTLVTPVLGYVHDDISDLRHLNFSQIEVAKVFTRSFEQLLDPNYKTIQEVEWKGKVHRMPVYGNDDGDERIWGLTAIILEAVIAEVITPIFM